MAANRSLLAAASGLVSMLFLALPPPTLAATFAVNWLDMSAVPLLGNVANGTVVNLPGYGNVKIEFTGSLTHTRHEDAILQSGAITNGANSYSWTPLDALFQLNLGSSGTMVSYLVKFTFLSGAVPASTIVLGTAGLGRLDLVYAGNITSITVPQNGTFLGDYALPNYGPTSFTSAPGSFMLENALPGDTTPGNPAFNSYLGIVRIDDAVSSLTLNVSHIGQDGFWVSVGLISGVTEVREKTWGGVKSLFR